jgi:hypothetical protein
MLNEKQTILALEEAMRGNRKFWERQGYDKREAFIKAIEEIQEMTTDPSSPCGDKLDIKTKEQFIYYRKMDIGL